MCVCECVSVFVSVFVLGRRDRFVSVIDAFETEIRLNTRSIVVGVYGTAIEGCVCESSKSRGLLRAALRVSVASRWGKKSVSL